MSLTFVFRLSVWNFRDLGSQLSLSLSRVGVEDRAPSKLSHIGTPRTNGSTFGVLRLKILDTSGDIPESVQILLVDLKLQSATQITEFASRPDIHYVVEEFLRLLHESRLPVALRVLVVIRLKTREDKFVAFRPTRLRLCLQFYENGRSYGKSSA